MRPRVGSDPAVLGALLVAGLALRVWISFGVSPAAANLSDSLVYVDMADNALFADPIRQAGYSVFLRAAHLLSAQIELTIVVQHRLGIATALVLFAAVRGAGGQVWAAAIAAAAVLLSVDQVFLEHSLMSETVFTFVLALAVYAATRALGADAETPGRPAGGARRLAAGRRGRGRRPAMASPRRPPARRGRPGVGAGRGPGRERRRGRVASQRSGARRRPGGHRRGRLQPRRARPGSLPRPAGGRTPARRSSPTARSSIPRPGPRASARRPRPTSETAPISTSSSPSRPRSGSTARRRTATTSSAGSAAGRSSRSRSRTPRRSPATSPGSSSGRPRGGATSQAPRTRRSRSTATRGRSRRT